MSLSIRLLCPSSAYSLVCLSLAIVRPTADGKKGESPPSFTRNSLAVCLFICVCVCARIYVCIQESPCGCWGCCGFLRGTVAMVTGPSQCCVTAAVPQAGEMEGGGVMCRWPLGTREDSGGGPERERDRAGLKGHWIWSVCCRAGLELTVRWLLLVLEILEYHGKIGNGLNPLEKSFELEALLSCAHLKCQIFRTKISNLFLCTPSVPSHKNC